MFWNPCLQDFSTDVAFLKTLSCDLKPNHVATFNPRQWMVILSHLPDLHTSSPQPPVGANGRTRPSLYKLTLVCIKCLRHATWLGFKSHKSLEEGDVRGEIL